MAKNPKCPNCGHRMALARQPAAANEQHTFECERCHLLFMTEDHQSVSGPPVYSTKNL
jgi:transcription elongation factor Elf1